MDDYKLEVFILIIKIFVYTERATLKGDNIFHN